MENLKYRFKETGEEVDALTWSKSSYMELREELIKLGEITKEESIPSDEEFIEDGISCLNSDNRFERI